ncbi:MAG: dihydrolipoyl dehydrogenase [Myxococcota bacterium]
MSTPYDVVVIGSGPGGYVAAIRAAHNGLKTALVERDGRLGGTCGLRGCIPTKSLLHSADVWEEFQKAKKSGVLEGEASLNFDNVQKERAKVVEKNSAGVTYLMKSNKIDVHTGWGTITGPNGVSVKGDKGVTELTAKAIIVATGSVVRHLPFLKTDGQKVVTSDEILELKSVPKSLLVLGAGAVGTEFASVYKRFGSDVTLVEMMDRVLPIEDEEVSAELGKALRKRGINMMTGTKLEKAEVTKNGVACVLAGKDGKSQNLEVEMLLVAVGRAPVTQNIGLEKVGVKMDKGGYIEVNEHLQTAVPSIYAIGDILRTPWLAHVASAQGIKAADHIAGKHVVPLNVNRVPSCTYCDPEVASVGLTEKTARDKGYDVQVGKFPFSAIGKARIINQTEGFVKVVSEKKYGEILGIHIIGPHATDLIGEAIVALQLESTAEELAFTVHPHPTLTEAMMEAAHAAAEGRAIHM